MARLSAAELDQLVCRFDGTGVRALVLLGSFARGTAGRFSDVDLLRIRADGADTLPGSGSHLLNGRLVVVGDTTPAELEVSFTQPAQVISVVPGLRTGRALRDRDGCFAAWQRRAIEFRWDAAMQSRADHWCSAQLVGWSEEAHKGLEGLRRGDEGRLLNARHGLSWGLARVLIVQRGLLLEGDNAFWPALIEELGVDSEWMRLCRRAFGVDGGPLSEQVEAGLRLYVVTAALLDDRLQPGDAPLVAHTVDTIVAVLGP